MSERKKVGGSMVKVAASGGRTVSMADVLEKEPSGEIAVPVTEIDTLESITLGFRQELFALKNEDGEGLAVLTTGGFGGTSIILEYTVGTGKKRKAHKATIDSIEMGIRWVEGISPEDGKRMRKATGRG